MSKTKIEWAEETLNPTIGCSKQSAGCKNCYAIIQANIRQANPNPKIAAKFAGTVKKEVGADGKIKLNWTGKINFDLETLMKPLFWRKPRKIFVNSLSDLFHQNIEEYWIDLFFAMATLSRQHIFQVLTKNPQRMVEYFSVGKEKLIERWSNAAYDFNLTRTGKEDDDDIDAVPCDVSNFAYQNFPLPNVWLGVSVENQKAADERIPHLLETPAAVRFLSCEPLLGDVNLLKYLDMELECFCGAISCNHPAVDWVIVGGESGNGARPVHPDWIRSIRDQCVSAGVKFFFKQWGKFGESFGCDDPCGHCVMALADGTITGTDWVAGAAMERSVQLHPFGKKKAGRTLDGRTWDEMPEVA